jgi:DnaJ-class molecular chaperone
MRNPGETTRPRQTHYEILQVAPQSDPKDIKESYHKSALLHHPDKKRRQRVTDDGDDSNSFKLIQVAWECLRDTERRQAYDQELWIQEKHFFSYMSSAIKLERSDCREEFVSNLGDYTLLYTCRCGQEIDTAEVIVDAQDESESTSNADLITCIGCSLVYDTSALWREDD